MIAAALSMHAKQKHHSHTEQGKVLIESKLEVLGFPDCSFVLAPGHNGVDKKRKGKRREKKKRGMSRIGTATGHVEDRAASLVAFQG
jgi:hypothetical protein